MQLLMAYERPCYKHECQQECAGSSFKGSSGIPGYFTYQLDKIQKIWVRTGCQKRKQAGLHQLGMEQSETKI